MDIIRKKKPWYFKYRYYLILGTILLVGFIYLIILALGPSRIYIDTDKVQIAEVRYGDFVEYVDVEGIVQPIFTLMVNADEEGNIERIVAEEGGLLNKGDTILTLTNRNLMHEIEDQRDEWNKQRISFQEKQLEMEQKSLTLKQQMLEATYELKKVEKNYALEKEEFSMGIRSKAQLEVAKDEYQYKTASTNLKIQSLQSDSAMTIVRKELLRNDYNREQKKWERYLQRTVNLVVRAPIDGQLSLIKVIPGQRVNAGENVAEIKILSQFKVHALLSEYYIDRVTTGLPATISYQGKQFTLKVSRVVPEVKDRMFEVDLIFTSEMPENVRLGKSFRVQIELGQPEQAIVIPRGNFYQETGGKWIYKLTADKSRAKRVPLTIGRQNPQQYEIMEGLSPGDWVITTGYDTFGDVEELIIK